METGYSMSSYPDCGCSSPRSREVDIESPLLSEEQQQNSQNDNELSSFSGSVFSSLMFPVKSASALIPVQSASALNPAQSTSSVASAHHRVSVDTNYVPTISGCAPAVPFGSASAVVSMKPRLLHSSIKSYLILKEMEGEYPNNTENPHILSPEPSLMEKWAGLSTPSPSPCIYRVPDRFRRVRPDDYTPRVISIGPFHHGKEALKAMEVHKMWYYKYFLVRTKSELNDYIGKIKAKEDQLRSCYGETIEFGSDEFAQIILVDAIFLIEFLCRHEFLRLCRCSEFQDENDCIFQDENDCIFGKPMMLNDLVHDLLMIENQLPFFILEELTRSFRGDPCIKELALSFLRCQGTTNFGVDLSGNSPAVKGEHFVNLYMELLISKAQKVGKKKKKSRVAPSIEMLDLAGVKLEVIKSTSEDGTTNGTKDFFGIEFDKGTLKIPKLYIGDWTELVLRNLLVFEQCSSNFDDYCISDYVIFMDELVNSPKDVELLVKYEIFENNLGGADLEFSNLINRLSTGLLYDRENFYYGDCCDDLHKFHSSRWHKWKAIMTRNYFSTPCTTISFVAAVFLLGLTLTQTVFSVLTYF